jgi:hypothetical protein
MAWLGVARADTPGTGDWKSTFWPVAVVAYHRPASIGVIPVTKPGALGEETRSAANALVTAYRNAGVATVKDAEAIGAVADGDDAAIVTRAAGLAVAEVAIVRVFLEGPTVRAIVTIYGADHQLITGFSAIAGQPLQVPAGGDNRAPVQAARAEVLPEATIDARAEAKSDEPVPDKDGVVRLWMRQPDPEVQLLRTDVAPLQTTHSTGVVVTSGIICRAPCGTVVDGSLGEPFTFGRLGMPLTHQFQLLGHTGDVTADVKLASPGLRFGGFWLLGLGLGGVAGGAALLASGNDDLHTQGGYFLVGGVVSTLVGYVMYRAGSPSVTLTAGRP